MQGGEPGLGNLPSCGVSLIDQYSQLTLCFTQFNPIKALREYPVGVQIGKWKPN